MKNKVKWIILAVFLIGIIGGAAALYYALREDYSPNNPAAQNEASSEKKYAAPDFTVLDQNGNQVRLSDYKGKPVVLNFWEPGAITARLKCRISIRRMRNIPMYSLLW